MRRITPISILHYTLLSFLLLLTLFPFYMLLITSLKNQDQIVHHFWIPMYPFHIENYWNVLAQIASPLWNSILITAGIIFFTLLNSTLAGYAFARFDFWGKNIIYYLVLVLMMVPSFLILIPQFILFKNLGLINTYWVQILGPMAGSSALATMLMRTFFEGLPQSLMESAEVEGADDFRIFWHIVLPLSKPILATVAVINTLLGWNNYIWPMVITSGEKVRPIILALSDISGPLDQVQGLQFAGYVITSIPLLFVFMFATKAFISGITSGSVKG